MRPSPLPLTKQLIAGVTLLTISGIFAATRGNARASVKDCEVQGVWRQQKVVVNGKTDSTSGQEIKLMTKKHFMWVSQEARRDTLPLKTYRDSVRAFNNAGGYGTYTVNGSNLTEHIEMFPDPTYKGKDWPATCRMEGGQWIHSWISPVYKDSTGRSRRDTVAEYYRRDE
jgi:hypothetical protein